MFFATKPTSNEIESFLGWADNGAFSYREIGATKDPSSIDLSSYIVDHNQILVGRGEQTFEKAKEAMREWRMFDMPWVGLCPPGASIDEGRTVAILIRHFGFYSLNAAKIVYTIDESSRFGFAYGTLEDHGESGEERFVVIFDNETGNVAYDLYAFSRPNHILARLGYPMTRMLQKRFAADSKQAMLRAVQGNRIN